MEYSSRKVLTVTFTVGVFAGLILHPFIYSLFANTADQASEELKAADSFITNYEPQKAYDALLAAMRIAPSNPKVFDTSLVFLKTFGKSEASVESRGLAFDIYQRSENLIPYLPLSRINAARDKHVELGKTLFPAQEDPFVEVQTSLKLVQQQNLPPAVKTYLLEAVNDGLKVVALRSAKNGKTDQNLWKSWEQQKAEHDKVQAKFIEDLYSKELKRKLSGWINLADQYLQDTSQSEDYEKIFNDDKGKSLDLLNDGRRLMRELQSFIEADVKSAITDGKDIENKLVKLARQRDWNHNRWTLAHLANVSQMSDKNHLEKLKDLSKIDEQRLSPYVLQQHKMAWEKYYSECKTNDDKLNASRILILKDYQP